MGALRPELPDNVEITTKRKLNGAAQPPGLITRASDHIIYRPGRPALALLDYDTKGMSPSVEARIDELGGYLPALLSVLPQLATAATMMSLYLVRVFTVPTLASNWPVPMGSMSFWWLKTAGTWNGSSTLCMHAAGSPGWDG